MSEYTYQMAYKACSCKSSSANRVQSGPSTSNICGCDICPEKDVGMRSGGNGKDDDGLRSCSSLNCNFYPVVNPKPGNTKCNCQFSSVTNVERPIKVNYNDEKLVTVTNLDCACIEPPQKSTKDHSKGQTTQNGRPSFVETLSLSIDSEELSFADTVNALKEEEQRLNNELNELEHIQQTIKDVSRSSELRRLTEVLRQLNSKNKTPTDNGQDVQLELRRREENVNGQMESELTWGNKRCEGLENQANQAGHLKKEWESLREVLRNELKKCDRLKSATSNHAHTSIWPLLDNSQSVFKECDQPLNDEVKFSGTILPTVVSSNTREHVAKETLPFKTESRKNYTENELVFKASSRMLYEQANNRGECIDDDYHFLMSILPTLRKVKAERKLYLREKIMSMIIEEIN